MPWILRRSPAKSDPQELPHVLNFLSEDTLENWLQLLELDVSGIAVPTRYLNAVVWLQEEILRDIVYNYGFPQVAAKFVEVF